jgi:hypothetical protein
MFHRSVRTLTVAAVLGACSVAIASGVASDGLPPMADQLVSQYPGLRTLSNDGRVLTFYGTRMTSATTPEQAVDQWLADYADAWGVASPELTLERSHEISDGKFTVFSYTQSINGVPVEHGYARILVLDYYGMYDTVVYASAKLADTAGQPFAPMAVTADVALANIASSPEYGDFDEWTTPELVVYYGEGDGRWIQPVQTWKFKGGVTDLAARELYTFYVDAATGDLIYMRDEVLNTDVSGNVTGKATPGVLPDSGSNPATPMPIDQIRVNISGGGNDYTDANGDYTIANGGTGAVTVTTKLGPSVGDGRWVWVDNQAGGELSLSQSVTPPGPGDFEFNSAPSELNTAQVNAFIHTTLTHDYIKDRAPSFNALDTSFRANVNISSTCNAYYDGSSINFYRSGGGCVNTAYSTVISHEYGHHVVNRLGLAQGAFGEGYSDTVSILLYDTAIVGEGFFTSGGHIRNYNTSNVQYPCSGEVHYCGELLAGIVNKIRVNFKSTYGSAAGLAIAQQLHVDWSMITIGGISDNSAHPQTAIEWLTVDDDDGDINNGTPNYTDICDAFSAHNIDCPDIQLIDFVYPNGLPDQLVPDQPTIIDVEVIPANGTPVAGTGMVHYSIDGSGFFDVPMSESTPNIYEATLPAVSCGSSIAYYFSAEAVGGLTFTDPSGAPGDTFSAVAATGTAFAIDDNFETDLGWSVVNENLQDGQWTRGVPVNGGRGDPPADQDGSGRCWVTDNVAGNSDVDGGPTRLISPVIDLSGAGGAIASYARWFTNDDHDADRLVVEMSDNGGTTWTQVESVPDTVGWVVKEWNVEDYVTLTSQFRMRFSATDNPNDSVTEAGVDRFKVLTIECTSCPPDWNGDGDVDSQDFTAFLNDFVAGNADYDGDGDTDSQDFVSFLNDFVVGC